jgi:NAD(P)-dependent dehydrogenase (short-subunit alcohol dehydrogenase family)
MATGELDGRVALVTGASQGGIGTAIAVRCAAEGARVAVSGRSREGLEACAAEIAAVGGECVVLPADLADPGGARTRLVADTEAALGPLDVLVNSAAVNGYRPFETFTRDDILRVYEVNVIAPWMLMTDAIAGMRERGRGWVLNLTSFAAELPWGPPFPTNLPAKGGSLYGSSKAALNRLTIAAASECEGQGIAVNALTPQAAALTKRLASNDSGFSFDDTMFEPLETMAEAALALVTGDPGRRGVLTARLAFSLQLLVELQRPVRDLVGRDLVAGWQPADIVAVLGRQADALAARGWPDAFSFGRPHSPDPRFVLPRDPDAGGDW